METGSGVRDPRTIPDVYKSVPSSSERLSMQDIMSQAFKQAVKTGWWENKDRNFAEQLCLMHSEISEALEEDRKPHPGTKSGEIYYVLDKDGIWKPEGSTVELADTVIRIADNCAGRGWDLVRALREKLVYNTLRPPKHGGKLY